MLAHHLTGPQCCCFTMALKLAVFVFASLLVVTTRVSRQSEFLLFGLGGENRALLWWLLFRLLLHLASSRTPKVRSSCRWVLRRSLAGFIDVLCWWCRVRRRVQGAVQAAFAAERVLSSLHHLLQRLQVRAAGHLRPHGAVRQVLHRLEDAREPDQVPLSAARRLLQLSPFFPRPTS
ncbi:hypothetical protein B296_00045199 [Ensete ventricosum]|uniref:Uncharacterized protein n=1 Tax=Ensete ventricosum TaxID=4639 RepID=A0A426Z825_ENSVE|nr:hypothetical protein B296_00045199 [Ensete ventricosum]